MFKSPNSAELRSKRKFERVNLPPKEQILLDDNDDFEEVTTKHKKQRQSRDETTGGVKTKKKEMTATTSKADETMVGVKPKKRQSRKEKNKELKVKLDAYPVLTARTTVKNLFFAIQELNEEQKEAVKEMGFGSLLELRVDKLPSALAYWVVDSFDAGSCDLKLADGRRLHIEEEDVYRVFRFPRGTRKIEKIKKNNKAEILQDWKSMIPGGEKWMVNAKDLKTEIVKLEDGGLWFKRNFMILMASALIETTPNGYIFPFIMECLVDMERIAEWNWCDYVMQSLIDTTRAWQGKTNQPFNGPTLFLMMVYVDRVSIFNKRHSRKFPIIGNWDYKTLKARELDEVQNGGFGRGALVNMIEIETGEIQTGNGMGQDEGTSEQAEKANVQDFIQKMVQKTESVARGLVELYDMIPSASKDVVQNESFRKAHEAVQKVIGNIVESPVKPSPKGKESVSISEDDDDIWTDAFIAELDAIEKAAMKKLEYVEYVKMMPSFSLGLGLTQEEEDVVHGPVGNLYNTEDTIQHEETIQDENDEENEKDKEQDDAGSENENDKDANDKENKKEMEKDDAEDQNEKKIRKLSMKTMKMRRKRLMHEMKLKSKIRMQMMRGIKKKMKSLMQEMKLKSKMRMDSMKGMRKERMMHEMKLKSKIGMQMMRGIKKKRKMMLIMKRMKKRTIRERLM